MKRKASNRKKVLLIDDDVSLLVTLSDFLKFEGYEVTTASSGEAGLNALEELTPDLIVLDMGMPGIGGVGFLKAIAGRNGKLRHPVLVLTARANMAEFFANVDVDGFVAKPCEPQDLLMEISRIVFLRSDPGGSAPRGLQGMRVLIGEDEDQVRESLVHAFTLAGFSVTSVSRGPEVIQAAVLEAPDVVLLKLIFENMNGDTLAGILRGMPKTEDVAVVLYDDTGGVVRPKSYRVSSAVAHRFVGSSDPNDLVSAVREVLEKKING
ncbi:MAG: response regulator [Verrucomicrobia bacterium]|nr:response regulator [Verrucomicrobiota bacterium]